MDNLDCEILQDLSRTHSITRTAMQLYLSQPALSKRIHKMEDEYQVQIVLRGQHGVDFTAEGELLVAYAKQRLHDETLLQERIQQVNGASSGTLRIGASGFVTRQIPPLLRLFKNQYPAVSFNIQTNWSENIYQRLIKDEVHIAFVRGDYHWHERKIKLFTESMSIISPYPIDVNDLPNLPRIDYKCDHKLQELIDGWWQERFSVPPMIEIKVDRTDTCCIMVNNHLGYAIIPTFIANQWKGQFFQRPLVDLHEKLISRATWLLCKDQSLAIPRVKNFVEFMKDVDFLKWIN